MGKGFVASVIGPDEAERWHVGISFNGMVFMLVRDFRTVALATAAKLDIQIGGLRNVPIMLTHDPDGIFGVAFNESDPA